MRAKEPDLHWHIKQDIIAICNISWTSTYVAAASLQQHIRHYKYKTHEEHFEHEATVCQQLLITINCKKGIILLWHFKLWPSPSSICTLPCSASFSRGYDLKSLSSSEAKASCSGQQTYEVSPSQWKSWGLNMSCVLKCDRGDFYITRWGTTIVQLPISCLMEALYKHTNTVGSWECSNSEACPWGWDSMMNYQMALQGP